MLVFWIRIAFILFAMMGLLWFVYRLWFPKEAKAVTERRNSLRDKLREIHGDISNQQLEKLVRAEENRLNSLKQDY